MTAFGRATGYVLETMVCIEMKSVNHRHLDVAMRVPKKYAALEEPMKKSIAARFSRGRIEVFVQCDGEGAKPRGLQLDVQLAKAYHELLVSMQRQFNLTGNIDISLMASFRDLFIVKEEDSDLAEEWKGIQNVLIEAINSMEQMRMAEGKTLSVDLGKRLDVLRSLVNDIRGRAPEVVHAYASRLKQRISNLVQEVDIDATRLAQEVATMAERSDVTEELVRITSHIEQFGALIEQDEPAGRRFDFLVQEMYREANTIGSKAGDMLIAHKVVDIKCELEKIREQIQNIE